MKYDLVVQLGSQVKYSRDKGYELAPHTVMRTEASAIALTTGIAGRLIVVGGSNFGVRYDFEKILTPANFSFKAFADAAFERDSEAAVIKDVLVDDYGIASNRILPETMSATTEENAEFLKIILRRRPTFRGDEMIAILTLLYHMEKALPVFQKAGLTVDPLFAENVLVDDEPSRADAICAYYGTPKGGKQYPVNRIRQLLVDGKSLIELMSIAS